jgi:hypothetical protein
MQTSSEVRLARPSFTRTALTTHWQPDGPIDEPEQVRWSVPLLPSAMQVPLQVTLQSPCTHSTSEPAPAFKVHEVPWQLIRQLAPQLPEQMVPGPQSKRQLAVFASQPSKAQLPSVQSQLVPAQTGEPQENANSNEVRRRVRMSRLTTSGRPAPTPRRLGVVERRSSRSRTPVVLALGHLLLLGCATAPMCRR